MRPDTGRRFCRAIMVTALFLLLGLGAWSQEGDEGIPGRKSYSGPSSPAPGLRYPEVKGWEQIERANCRRFHQSPLSLLAFLPGPLFLIYRILSRRIRAGAGLGKAGGMLLSIFILTGASGPRPADILQAEACFRGGRFDAALELYRKAASASPCNPALDYNLGLCYHCLDKRGRAIFHLRRAVSKAPFDMEARSFLARLENHYGLSGQFPIGPPLGPDFVYALAIFFSNGAFIASGLLVDRRRATVLIILVLMAVFALVSGWVFIALSSGSAHPIGVVFSGEAALKRIPLESGRTWLRLKEGTTLAVLGRSRGFYLVETGFGLKGWIKEGCLLLD